jgi:hypothetical protein
MVNTADANIAVQQARSNPTQTLARARAGDPLALCAVQGLLVSQPNLFNPAHAIEAACAALSTVDALEVAARREIFTFVVTASANAWSHINTDNPTRATRTLFAAHTLPVLVAFCAHEDELTRDEEDRDPRGPLTMLLCNALHDWNLAGVEGVRGLAGLCARYATDLVAPPSAARQAQHAQSQLTCAVSLHRLVEARACCAELFEDREALRGTIALVPVAAHPDATGLLLEALDFVGTSSEAAPGDGGSAFHRMLPLGLPAVLAAVLRAPDRARPNGARPVHLGALNCCRNLIIADQASSDKPSARALLAAGVCDLLCVELCRPPTRGLPPEFDKHVLAAHALTGMLADLAGLKKYCAEPSTVALLTRAAAVRSEAKAACASALTVLGLLSEAKARPSNIYGCHYAVCAAHEAENGPKFSLCSRCMRVRYCSRECQKADWKAHKATCSASVADQAGRSSSELKTKKASSKTNAQVSSAWLEKHQFRLIWQARFQLEPQIATKDLVLYADFTTPGADGVVPAEAFMHERDAKATLARIGSVTTATAHAWWSNEQWQNLSMYFEKRRQFLSALAAERAAERAQRRSGGGDDDDEEGGLEPICIVYACRFDTSVFSGRWTVTNEESLAMIEHNVMRLEIAARAERLMPSPGGARAMDVRALIRNMLGRRGVELDDAFDGDSD